MSQTARVSAALLSDAADVLEVVNTEYATSLARDLRAAAGEAAATSADAVMA